MGGLISVINWMAAVMFLQVLRGLRTVLNLMLAMSVQP